MADRAKEILDGCGHIRCEVCGGSGKVCPSCDTHDSGEDHDCNFTERACRVCEGSGRKWPLTPCRPCALRAIEAARDPALTTAAPPHDPHGWIQTFTGRKFFPLAPDINQICIEDIAHALSNLCRYTGHTKHFYSVAEHSLLVSHQVPRRHALAGLLHDATEAYLIDLAKPVKRLAEMKPYRDAEDRLARVIAERFGLDTVEPPEVKEADLRLLATEAPQLMAPLHPEWKVPAEPYEGLLVAGHAPGVAERWFLNRFVELTR